MRCALAALLAAAAVSGCGSEEPKEQPAQPKTPATHLVVAVTGEDTKTIDCPGHALCARLSRTPMRAFAPAPRRTACTQIYGGDARASVEGTLRGDPVNATFALNNGCEISRWARLAWLLGKPAGVPPQLSTK